MAISAATAATEELGATASLARRSARVNSADEWSPLREVIVGSSLNFERPDLDLSFKLFFHDNAYLAFYYPQYGAASNTDGAYPGDGALVHTPSYKVKQRYLEELAEDIDGFVDTLVWLGVTVHRPTALSGVPSVQTPYWESTVTPALNVRDQAIVLGDEIIETPPQIRARYFENDLLKPIFYEYFRGGSRWTVMPRPVMTDMSFDLSYVEASGRAMIATEPVYRQSPSSFDVGIEIMIDAAQCIRLGRDVLVNVATVNHELGLRWLEQHLGGRFRLHRLYRMTDNHIDSMVLPLRPGTLLVRAPHVRDMLPAALQKWDVIYPPEPSDTMFPRYDADDLIVASKYIDLNVLSVSPDVVIVNSLCPELIRVLERHRFTVVPVRHRHRRLFGGGFHCFTLDTVRDAGIEDYLDG
jgi:glycine amidinotransferase